MIHLWVFHTADHSCLFILKVSTIVKWYRLNITNAFSSLFFLFFFFLLKDLEKLWIWLKYFLVWKRVQRAKEVKANQRWQGKSWKFFFFSNVNIQVYTSTVAAGQYISRGWYFYLFVLKDYWYRLIISVSNSLEKGMQVYFVVKKCWISKVWIIVHFPF